MINKKKKSVSEHRYNTYIGTVDCTVQHRGPFF